MVEKNFDEMEFIVGKLCNCAQIYFLKNSLEKIFSMVFSRLEKIKNHHELEFKIIFKLDEKFQKFLRKKPSSGNFSNLVNLFLDSCTL